MRRREFIAGLGGTVAWPLAATAQQPRLPVMGYLNSGSPAESAYLVAAFNQGLNEAGFTDGRNVVIEYSWARGQNDRLPDLAADLVRRQVAVIAASGGTTPALAAKAATGTTPIVFVVGGDPVDDGLVASMNRPNANLTGVTVFSGVLGSKRLELLHELVPKNAAIGLLANPTTFDSELRIVQAAASVIGREVRILNIRTDSDIDFAFATLVEQHIGGLLVQGEAFFTTRRDRLVLLTTRHVFAWREFATVGGLMSYGTNLSTSYRMAGTSANGPISSRRWCLQPDGLRWFSIPRTCSRSCT
jgi:putative ABC transport system substrate-binding protein